MKRLLNIEYATIHGTYWMYYGVICSFASVFLLSKNYTNSDIGLILAVGNIVAVILQPIIADFADRSKRISILGITELLALLLIILTGGMFFFDNKSLALSGIFIMLVGWLTVIQPLINTLNFKLEQSGIHINFGVGRSIGSLAYSLLCAVLGSIVQRWGATTIPITGEIVLILFLISLIITNHHFKKCSNETNLKLQDDNLILNEITLTDFVRNNKAFIIVTVGVVGLFFSNAILNNFMMQIVVNVGGNSEDMGRILSIMAALEIPTMVFFDQIKKKFKCSTLIKVSSVAFVIKILLCYIANTVKMLLLAQFMQLFSFALFLPAMVHFIDDVMEEGESVKGQAMFTLMITVGTVFASLMGGLILDLWGAKSLLLASTIITAIGAAIILCAVNKVNDKGGSING